MKILTGLPPETAHPVRVHNGDSIAHEFTAVWRTPDDNDTTDIRDVSIGIVEAASTALPADAMERARAGVNLVREQRAAMDGLIRSYFIRAVDADYEPDDLNQMLRYDNYRRALLQSLTQVANGEALAKNFETPGTTIEQDGYPASEPAAA